MPISPSDLKELAKELAVVQSDEVKLRASASRAYYSAFHALLPIISALPASTSCPIGVKHVTHEEMSQRLQEWQVASVFPALASLKVTKSQVRRALDVCRAVRVVADYRLKETVSLGEAQTQVERCKQILRAVMQMEAAINPQPVAAHGQ